MDIILVTHNNFSMASRCIEALYDNTPEPFRLILVDDSEGITRQYLESLPRKNMLYLRPEAPFKSGNQAINMALQYVEGSYFVFLTQTTIVEPEWLSPLVSVMENMKDIGVCGIKLLYQNGLIEHAGIAWNKEGVLYDLGRYSPGHRHTNLREVPAVGWALAIIRRQALNGRLPEDRYLGFRGYDDVDNCLEIRRAGWKVLYCGYSSAYHYARAIAGDSDDYRKAHTENRIRFKERWCRDGAEKAIAS